MEAARLMMPKEVLRWYQHLSAEDQAEISVSIQKQMAAKLLPKKEPTRGKAIHDNDSK